MEPHPTWDKLEGMITRRLSDVDLLAVETHVRDCHECQKTLRMISTHSAATTIGERPPEPPTMPEQPAELPPELNNHPRYRITGLLGAGGMGAVYRAEHRLLHRDVVLKVILRDLIQDAEMVERFQREARLAARLSHPNVVTVYEAEQIGLTHVLVMEFVDGSDAEQVIRRRGQLPVAEACEIVRQAALGLQHAHERGLVHRDIKPGNLLLSHDGTVKVLDMGLAVLKGETPGGSRLTAKTQVLGTLDYMAPEQWQDSHTVDIRADIYSLGCTLYELLAGKPPFTTEGESSPLQQMWAHTHREPTPLRDLRPDVPAELAAEVHRMLAKDRGKRPQTPLEAAEALEPFTAGADLPALLGRPSTRTTRPPSSRAVPRRKRAPLWPLLAAGLVVSGIVGGGLLVYLFLGGSRPPDDQGPIFTGPPLKVGILHSDTGFMKQSETPVEDATRLAVDEINEKGGLLGRKVVVVDKDGRSDAEVFAREAEELITNDGVVTIFGCWTSDSRKAVKSVVEKHDHLLVYPLQYEGMEQSPNIMYLGAAPNQQILPAVKWCCGLLNKKKLFLVGSDYVFPRAAGAIIRDEAAVHGATIVGEEYLLLAASDVDDVVKKIVAAKPDIIFNLINGDTNVPFFRGLRAAGVTSKQMPTISFSITENVLENLRREDLVGDYAAWNYFMSIDRPQNQEFVKRFRAKYGERRPTADPMEAAYVGVHLWAEAVRTAGSDDVKAIRQAMKGLSFDAPEGVVRIDPETQHAWKTVRIGRIMDNGAFEVVYSSEKPIQPMPYPPSRTRPQWDAFLGDLHRGWGGRWSNPGK